jgi:hypothetical protein
LQLVTGKRPKTNDNVDTGNLEPVWWVRKIVSLDMTAEHIQDFAAAFNKEVVMVCDVGVVPGSRALDGERANKARLGELTEGIVDGCNGQHESALGGLVMELFGCDVTVSFGKQEVGQGNTLLRRSEAS